MVGETAQICIVKGMNIGQIIKVLVNWTWYMPVLSMFHIPLIGGGLFIGLLALIHKSFRGLTSALIGFFSIWYMCFAPIIAGIIFVSYLANQAQCSLNEGGVGACYLFGLDMGSTFHTAATIPWLLFIFFPLCAVASVVYVVVILASQQQRNLD